MNDTKEVTVRIRSTTIMEIETEWYPDEETENQFLERIRRGVACGDFTPRLMEASVDKVVLVKDVDSWAERMEIWI